MEQQYQKIRTDFKESWKARGYTQSVQDGSVVLNTYSKPKSVDGLVAEIVLNQPDIRNAVSYDMVESLNSSVKTITRNSDYSFVYIRGEGKGFCAGIQLIDLANGNIPFNYFKLWEDTLRTLETMNKPTMALMHGYVIGGGLQLAIVCDHRVAVSNTSFGLPAVYEGLIPGLAPVRLPRLIESKEATKLIKTGESIDTFKAKDIGLIDKVISPIDFVSHVTENIDEHISIPLAELYSSRMVHQLTGQEYESHLSDYLYMQKNSLKSPYHREVMAEIRKQGLGRFIERVRDGKNIK